MTTQSLPISKTRKDIIVSVIVAALIIGAGALVVYYSRPGGLIMRQPRMTFNVTYALIIGASAFTFLKRHAQGYISRVLAWGFCIAFAIGLAAFYFISDEKSKSWGFKGLLFALTFTLSATILTEAMVFYRKKMSQKSRSNILHQLLFAIVCASFIGAVGYFYTEKAVKGGAVLNYVSTKTPTNTVPLPTNSGPGSIDPSQLPTEDPTLNSLPFDTTPIPTDTTPAS